MLCPVVIELALFANFELWCIMEHFFLDFCLSFLLFFCLLPLFCFFVLSMLLCYFPPFYHDLFILLFPYVLLLCCFFSSLALSCHVAIGSVFNFVCFSYSTSSCNSALFLSVKPNVILSSLHAARWHKIGINNIGY